MEPRIDGGEIKTRKQAVFVWRIVWKAGGDRLHKRAILPSFIYLFLLITPAAVVGARRLWSARGGVRELTLQMWTWRQPRPPTHPIHHHHHYYHNDYFFIIQRFRSLKSLFVTWRDRCDSFSPVGYISHIHPGESPKEMFGKGKFFKATGQPFCLWHRW